MWRNPYQYGGYPARFRYVPRYGDTGFEGLRPGGNAAPAEREDPRPEGNLQQNRRARAEQGGIQYHDDDQAFGPLGPAGLIACEVRGVVPLITAIQDAMRKHRKKHGQENEKTLELIDINFQYYDLPMQPLQIPPMRIPRVVAEEVFGVVNGRANERDLATAFRERGFAKDPDDGEAVDARGAQAGMGEADVELMGVGGLANARRPGYGYGYGYDPGAYGRARNGGRQDWYY